LLTRLRAGPTPRFASMPVAAASSALPIYPIHSALDSREAASSTPHFLAPVALHSSCGFAALVSTTWFIASSYSSPTSGFIDYTWSSTVLHVRARPLHVTLSAHCSLLFALPRYVPLSARSRPVLASCLHSRSPRVFVLSTWGLLATGKGSGLATQSLNPRDPADVCVCPISTRIGSLLELNT